MIHPDTARNRTGLRGKPQARKGRAIFGLRTRNTITQETAKLANNVSVKPAYCWIWSTRHEKMMIDVTIP